MLRSLEHHPSMRSIVVSYESSSTFSRYGMAPDSQHIDHHPDCNSFCGALRFACNQHLYMHFTNGAFFFQIIHHYFHKAQLNQS